MYFYFGQTTTFAHRKIPKDNNAHYLNVTWIFHNTKVNLQADCANI